MSFYLQQQESCSKIWNVRHSFHLDVYPRVEWLGTVLVGDVNTDCGTVSTGNAHCSHMNVQACHNAIHITWLSLMWIRKAKLSEVTAHNSGATGRSPGVDYRKVKNVNLSLSTPWRDTGGTEVRVYLHSFLTSALDGGEWTPRAGLDVLEKRCISSLSEFKPRTVHPVSQDAVH
jgi:hypothetical protein